MQAQPNQRPILRVLEDEITRLESETQRQLEAVAKLPVMHWQRYLTYAQLGAAKLRLIPLYEQRRRLWVEQQS